MGYGTMEEKLAALLLAHQGEPLSGEAISRQMGVTRAAVWKGMDRLRQAGWEIGSATNRGYRLVEVPDLMTAPVVEHFLPPDRKAPVYAYEELDSTITQGQRMERLGDRGRPPDRRGRADGPQFPQPRRGGHLSFLPAGPRLWRGAIEPSHLLRRSGGLRGHLGHHRPCPLHQVAQ